MGEVKVFQKSRDGFVTLRGSGRFIFTLSFGRSSFFFLVVFVFVFVSFVSSVFVRLARFRSFSLVLFVFVRFRSFSFVVVSVKMGVILIVIQRNSDLIYSPLAMDVTRSCRIQ